MFTVISIMFAGMFIGYLLRKRKFTEKLDRPIFLTIITLLFFMGLYVGANENIVRNLGKLGGQALVITLFSVTGTLLAAALLDRFVFRKNKKGDRE